MRTKIIFLLIMAVISTAICSCGSEDYLTYREKYFTAGVVCRMNNQTYIYSVESEENINIKFTSPKGLNGVTVKEDNGGVTVTLNGMEIKSRQYEVMLEFANLIINKEISRNNLKSAEKDGELICAIYQNEENQVKIWLKKTENGYAPTKIQTEKAEIDIEWFEWG